MLLECCMQGTGHRSDVATHWQSQVPWCPSECAGKLTHSTIHTQHCQRLQLTQGQQALIGQECAACNSCQSSDQHNLHALRQLRHGSTQVQEVWDVAYYYTCSCMCTAYVIARLAHCQWTPNQLPRAKPNMNNMAVWEQIISRCQNQAAYPCDVNS